MTPDQILEEERQSDWFIVYIGDKFQEWQFHHHEIINKNNADISHFLPLQRSGLSLSLSPEFCFFGPAK